LDISFNRIRKIENLSKLKKLKKLYLCANKITKIENLEELEGLELLELGDNKIRVSKRFLKVVISYLAFTALDCFTRVLSKLVFLDR